MNVDAQPLTAEEEEAAKTVDAKVTSMMRSRGNVGASKPSEVDVQMDAKALALQDGMANGINLRCALGQKFAIDPQGGNSSIYMAASREDKAEFRKRWCEDGFNKHVQILKEKIIEERKTKLSSMKMASGRELIKREGLEAFLKYSEKCIAYGPPFVEWDSMWERWTFGDVTKMYTDTVSKLKRATLRETSDANQGANVENARAAGAAGNPKEGQVETQPVPKRRRLTTKGGLPPSGGVTPQKLPKEKPPAIGDDKQASADATKLRNKIQQAQASARQIHECMKAKPQEWEWANKSKLVKAQEALAEFVQSDSFVTTYVAWPNKRLSRTLQVRTHYAPQRVHELQHQGRSAFETFDDGDVPLVGHECG